MAGASVPAKRTPMRKSREVLRLRLEAGLSMRQVSLSTKEPCWRYPETPLPGQCPRVDLAPAGGAL